MKVPTILIDGYGFVFRAYHVQPPLTSPKGQPVGALFGMASMMLKLVSDFHPTKCAIVFDGSGKNHRHELYQQYKAHRPPTPEDLKIQLPLIRELATVLGFPILEKPNTEADDVIATVATKLAAEGEQVVIVSSDKDLMQLISDYIKMYDPLKGRYIDEASVKEKFGLGPNKVRECLALIGDSSDNIPGAPGIGPKTAAELIDRFGDVESVIARADEIKQDKRRTSIIENQDQIRLSWELVGLKYDVKIENNGALEWKQPDQAKLSEFLASYNFKSLIPRAEKLFGMDLEHRATESATIEKCEITIEKDLVNLMEKSLEKGLLAICVDDSRVIHLAIEEKKEYFINLENDKFFQQGDLFSSKTQLNLRPLYDILGDNSVLKITHDLKRLWYKLSFDQNAFTTVATEDLALMRYACTAGLEQVSTKDFLSQNSISSFISIYHSYKQDLIDSNAASLYYDIDLPLASVLFVMEQVGVKIDQRKLAEMSEKFGEEIANLEKKIYQIAGQEFNVGSPKQLGEILFEKMNLKSSKISAKSKTYSTGAEVLESLSEAGFEIADLVLRWRELSKLKNTYTDSLPKKISPKTGRVHTHFVQNLTSTGRLSSVDPNLQNIPVRSKEGMQVRSAFVAKEGCKLLSADYSQIELRILAHVANVPHLRDAFKNGEDIHKATAAQVFGLQKEEVTNELRRKAKAINFGIIYGISAFGLAKQLAVGNKEASEIQARYFQEYPGIQEYMDKMREFAKGHGYVANMFGRRCILPMINDRNFAMRSFAERAAINAPLQGANADIIKLAMISIDRKFKELDLKSKMILQVHDELIFEVPDTEVALVTDIVRTIMQDGTLLDVPLVVDVGVADNWSSVKNAD